MTKTFPLLLLLAGAAHGQVNFTHGDWQLICDNTNTCRAAGYQADGEGAPLSVLLTRPAGAGAAVSGEVSWLSADDQQREPNELTFTLDGKDLGTVRADDGSRAQLNDRQVAALIAALQVEKASIKFSGGQQQWELPANGAAAVLLKMDEAQGRIDTASALMAKRRGNGTVSVKAAATPIIKVVKLAPAEPSTIDDEGEHRRLVALLDPDKQCLSNDPEANQEFYSAADKKLQVWPLGEKYQLVAALCGKYPYNPSTYRFGLFDSQLQKLQQRLGSDDEPLNEFTDGTINGTMKGRGLGDCYHSVDYRWNGEKFVKTSEWDSGLCRGFAGGAWQLPIFVSEVQEAK